MERREPRQRLDDAEVKVSRQAEVSKLGKELKNAAKAELLVRYCEKYTKSRIAVKNHLANRIKTEIERLSAEVDSEIDSNKKSGDKNAVESAINVLYEKVYDSFKDDIMGLVELSQDSESKPKSESRPSESKSVEVQVVPLKKGEKAEKMNPSQRLEAAKDLDSIRYNGQRLGRALGNAAKGELMVRFCEKYSKEPLAQEVMRAMADLARLADSFENDELRLEELRNKANTATDFGESQHNYSKERNKSDDKKSEVVSTMNELYDKVYKRFMNDPYDLIELARNE